MDTSQPVLVNVIGACRVCASSRIERILDFGEMPLANRYLTADTLRDPEPRVPLEVILCADCGCVQLAKTIDPAILFSDYLYTSSTSGTLAAHFKRYAKDTVASLNLDPERDFIVGIGGNDGPLEAAYQSLGFRVLNVEPAANIAALSVLNGVPTLNAWFNEAIARAIVAEHGQAALVTCNNCFAHIPDVHGVVRALNTILRPDGWFVAENAYWLDAVAGNHFDQIYHEHCFYWTVRALVVLFRKHGLSIGRVEHNTSQGGSIRVFVSCNRHPPSSSTFAALADEESHALFDPFTYEQWRKRIVVWQLAARAFLGPLDSLCAYGVPAKFTMLSEQLGFTASIVRYAVEDSPVKVGRYTPGSHIPIVKRTHFVECPTEHCVITAANYADLIVASNPQFKGDWIVLTPEPRKFTV